jgi:hypothetical protein
MVRDRVDNSFRYQFAVYINVMQDMHELGSHEHKRMRYKIALLIGQIINLSALVLQLITIVIE